MSGRIGSWDATRPRRVSRRAALIGGAAALSFAAARGSAALADAPLDVVATTAMVEDAARRVGGERVATTALMGPGVDPHGYRQTRTDIVRMSRADLVLWNGLYLEAQLEEFLFELGARRPVTAVAEAVPEAERLGHEDYEGRWDPHVWMDPTLWRHVVDATRDALTAVDPEGAEIFAENAARHAAELAELDAYSRQVLESVPQEARVLVTAHDAFRYFSAAYGYEVHGVQGISTESEAGLRRIEELVDLIVDRGVRAVFVESTVAERNVRALIEGAAARGAEVAVGGELFSDAMGPPGTYEGAYLGMIDHNVTTIARALGGDAPTRGMRDQLAATFE